MRRALTDQDIQELRHQCRMGYILPTMLFLIGSLFIGLMYELYFHPESGIDPEMTAVIAFGFLIISLFLSFVINNKYYTDIRNGEKKVEAKIVDKKENKVDFEAGSGTLWIGDKGKPFDKYSIIVDHTRYRVDKDLYEKCAEGGEVLFNYGPVSGYLMGIDLKQ